jgi:hypothetical protein
LWGGESVAWPRSDGRNISLASALALRNKQIAGSVVPCHLQQRASVMARFYSRTRIPDIEQESDMTSSILESILSTLTGGSATMPPRDPDDDDDEDEDEDDEDESEPDEPPVVREPDDDE